SLPRRRRTTGRFAGGRTPGAASRSRSTRASTATSGRLVVVSAERCRYHGRRCNNVESIVIDDDSIVSLATAASSGAILIRWATGARNILSRTARSPTTPSTGWTPPRDNSQSTRLIWSSAHWTMSTSTPGSARSSGPTGNDSRSRRRRNASTPSCVFQLRGLAVAQFWQQLRFIAFFISGLPLRECCAPAKINGLATGSAKRESPDVERCSRLTVTKIGHDGGQISPRDHVKQFLLVDRKTRPDLSQVVDRVDVGNDGVMAGALKSLVTESAACALSDNRGIGHRDRTERLTRLQACHDLRNIRYQALREITYLGAGIGDDLLTLAVIELLGDFQRLAGRPAEARAAQFLIARGSPALRRPSRMGSSWARYVGSSAIAVQRARAREIEKFGM